MTNTTLMKPRTRLLRNENLEITSEGSEYTLTLVRGGLHVDEKLVQALQSTPGVVDTAEITDVQRPGVYFTLDERHTPTSHIIDPDTNKVATPVDVPALTCVIEAVKALVARQKSRT